MGNFEFLLLFFGVFIVVKDLNCVVDMLVSYGVLVLKENLVIYDDGVVVKMKVVGFIIVGKIVIF